MKEKRQIRNNTIKRAILLPISLSFIPFLDMHMMLYRPFERFHSVKFLSFMIQYEALRTLIEVIFESIPQSLIQLVLFFTCDSSNNTCGFDANETLDLYFFQLTTEQTLMLSLTISLISVSRRNSDTPNKSPLSAKVG